MRTAPGILAAFERPRTVAGAMLVGSVSVLDTETIVLVINGLFLAEILKKLLRLREGILCMLPASPVEGKKPEA